MTVYIQAGVKVQKQPCNTRVSQLVYFIGAVRKTIDYYLDQRPHPLTISWSKGVSLKANCFVWRDLQAKIASTMDLRARGVVIDTTICGICINEEEYSNHILIQCLFANAVREKIFKWCDIENQQFNNMQELLGFVANWNGNKYRNDKLFNQVDMSPICGAGYIKSLAYLWIQSRRKDVMILTCEGGVRKSFCFAGNFHLKHAINDKVIENKSLKALNGITVNSKFYKSTLRKREGRSGIAIAVARRARCGGGTPK
ncbi:hypothetical protein LXL04_038608 [Taraxacum kok-saghyz]